MSMVGHMTVVNLCFSNTTPDMKMPVWLEGVSMYTHWLVVKWQKMKAISTLLV